MAKIISNKVVANNIYLVEIEGKWQGKPGQFYMIRTNGNYPLLSRPISIFSIEDNSIKFMYQVVGQGTQILSQSREGDQIILNGPYGNGFPSVTGKVALVGGGIGAAPLFETGKQLLNDKKVEEVELFVGFREDMVINYNWQESCNKVHTKIGGFVTELIDINKFDAVFTCGPDVMMKEIVRMSKNTKTQVYVSVESRMACGVGACLVCTCKTKEGNKRTCKDGPVFLGEEVYDV